MWIFLCVAAAAAITIAVCTDASPLNDEVPFTMEPHCRRPKAIYVARQDPLPVGVVAGGKYTLWVAGWQESRNPYTNYRQAILSAATPCDRGHRGRTCVPLLSDVIPSGTPFVIINNNPFGLSIQDTMRLMRAEASANDSGFTDCEVEDIFDGTERFVRHTDPDLRLIVIQDGNDYLFPGPEMVLVRVPDKLGGGGVGGGEYVQHQRTHMIGGCDCDY